MKQGIIVFLAVLMVAAGAFAQTPPAGQQPTSKPAAPQGQPPQPAAPQGQQPAAPGQPGAATPQPGAPAQPAGPRLPQAKSQEELTAFQQAYALNDPAQLEAAANDFATKFPDSELKVLLYEKDLSLYQNSNNPEKTVEVGKKVIGIDPNSAPALVSIAGALASRTRKTDLDAAERWAEAKKDAEQALELIQSGAGVPPSVPPDRTQAYKDLVSSMAYSALGAIDFGKEDYAAAEKNLRKSVSYNDVEQDPVSWLQLSVALDKQQKYQEALGVADKCVTIAGQGPAGDLCKQEGNRLRSLTGAAKPGAATAPPGKPAGTAAPAGKPAPSTPPPQQTPPPPPK
jgi:tetratricopeptide (TPR) repeat protein